MHRVTLILLLASDEVLAHPGHGPGGWPSAGLLHLLTEPDHLAMGLFPVAAGVGWWLWRLRKARAAQCTSLGARRARDPRTSACPRP